MRRTRIWPLHALRVAFGHRPPFALCYHGVGDVAPAADPQGLFVEAGLFAAHLDTLADDGYALVGTSELWRRVGAEERERIGALTFDDALAQTAETAMPLLAERGMRASVYVATALLDQPHPHVEGERVMAASQVVELADAGFEIGAHTVDHPYLPSLSDDELHDQLRRSRAQLEDLIGERVASMAYPFGAVDERVARAARDAGYETACGCAGPGPWDPMRLPREPVFPSVTTLRLRVKAAGLYGPVHRLSDLGATAVARRLLRRGGS